MNPNWRQLRKLIIRGPDPGNDPYRLAQRHINPIGRYDQAWVDWQRSRGGDAYALGVPYPWNNPIGAGIVWREQGAIFGPPPARYVFGTLFFQYPTPGQSIPEVVQPGGPLYDPATLAALLGTANAPQTVPVTTASIGAAAAGAQRMGMAF